MKILVPIDGSQYSRRALEKARVLAEALNAEVTILNVLNPAIDLRSMQNRPFYEEVNKNALARARELLEDGLKVFSGYTNKVEAISKNGDTVDEIIKLADSQRFDLVIMGSRGAGVFSRTLLGSVSDKVVHHINTSVLIVK